MLKLPFKTLLLLFLLIGCSDTVTPTSQTEVNKLTRLFRTLDTTITQDEALQLSQDIFLKTEDLRKEFDRTSNPLWHNFLVNIGIQEKGLCYHWSDALYAHLLTKNYPSFEFHLMGANIGEYWSEHNVLMVVGKDKDMKEGIIIDPWRDSEKLYFSKVTDDTDYVWKHRMHRSCQKK
jgi:hypothetical protein